MQRHAVLAAVLAIALAPAAGAEPLRLVAPAEGEAVPLLNETQKAFVSLPRAERVEAYVLDLGFTPGEIDAFREIMLESAQ